MCDLDKSMLQFIEMLYEILRLKNIIQLGLSRIFTYIHLHIHYFQLV